MSFLRRAGSRGARAAAACAAILFLATSAFAQIAESTAPAGKLGAPRAESTAEGTAGPAPTAAERYASVRRLLDADKQRLGELEKEAGNLEEEFQQASAEFSRLDGELQAARVQQSSATNGRDRAEATARVAAIEKEWGPARDAFDVVIQQRRAVNRQIETLTEKIRLEQNILDQMSSAEAASPASLNPSAPNAAPGSAASPNNATPATGATAGGAGTTVGPLNTPATAPGAPSVAPTAPATPAAPGTAATPAATGASAAPTTSVPGLPIAIPGATPAGTGATATGTTDAAILTAPKSDEALDEELVAARREQLEKERALQNAKRRVENLDQAIEVFERDQEATQELFEAARRQLNLAKNAETALVKEMQQRSDAGAPADELARLEDRRREAERRVDEARQEVELQTARLVESNDALKHLRSARQSAVERVEQAEDALEPARSRVWYLESPITPSRLWKWALDAGPRIVGILTLMTVFWYLAKLIASRQVMEFALRGRRGSSEERESRANTLRRVFENAAGMAILLIGGLALLDQLGVNVTVLLGGAAVLGAAIAFGSQNLIKDFFSGFMILVENQYSVGNVVRIGDVSGSVEDISLRMTVLRDEEGVVHFIPHSQIAKVSNLTYGWSQAVYNIRVAYDQDVDQIMAIVMDLAREMRDDPTYGPKMLGQPELSGVEEIGDSYVVIKFLTKTRPLQQWSVKRELLRRIKNRFDKLGVRTPTPRYQLEHRGLDPLVAEIDDAVENGVFPHRRDGLRDRRRNGNGTSN